jgi:hypothetical protein
VALAVGVPVAVVLIAFGLIALAYRLRGPRARRLPLPAPSWARAAGDEFGELSEAERCDLVFAVAALDDDGSKQLLESALDDPSEAVALAAACSLTRLGRRETVERHLTGRPGERATRIARTVELLSP